MTRKEFQERIISQLPVMYRVAFALSGDRDEANDMVQDTMIRLWNGRENLDNVSNIPAYCLMALKRRFYDGVKSKKTTESICDISEEATEKTDMLEHRSALELVRKIIEILPEGQRTVIRLSTFAGRSNDEISQITGYSNENVRTMLSRARKTIKKLFILNN